jgi:hypothetical protein
MRLLAIHDADGNIARFVMNPSDGPRAVVAAQVGEFVTEIEAPDLEFDAEDPRSLHRVLELMDRYRVEPGGPRQLVERNDRHN